MSNVLKAILAVFLIVLFFKMAKIAIGLGLIALIAYGVFHFINEEI